MSLPFLLQAQVWTGAADSSNGLPFSFFSTSGNWTSNGGSSGINLATKPSVSFGAGTGAATSIFLDFAQGTVTEMTFLDTGSPSSPRPAYSFQGAATLGIETDLAVNAGGNVTFTNSAVRFGRIVDVDIAGGATVDIASNVTHDQALSTLTKSGAGTLSLSGGGTYNGMVNVTAGGLVVNGSLANAYVSLNGGVLNGTGTVGRLGVHSGGTISPGASPGTLVADGDTGWAGGGTYLWEINSVTGQPGQQWDLLSISKALNISANAGDKFTLKLASLTPGNVAGDVTDFDSASDYSFVFATAVDGINGFDSDAFFIDVSGFTNPFTGAWSMTQDGNSLRLNYTAATAVPEPSAYAALVGACVLGLTAWRRRARRGITITPAANSAAANESVSLTSVGGDTRNRIAAAIPALDLEKAWADGATGWAAITAEHGRGGVTALRTVHFVSDKLAAEWQKSTTANAYKPLRDVINERYKLCDSVGEAKAASRTLLREALALADGYDGGKMPDSLYNWIK